MKTPRLAYWEVWWYSAKLLTEEIIGIIINSHQKTDANKIPHGKKSQYDSSACIDGKTQKSMGKLSTVGKSGVINTGVIKMWMGYIQIVEPEVVYIQEIKTRGCKILVFPFSSYSWSVMRAEVYFSWMLTFCVRGA